MRKNCMARNSIRFGRRNLLVKTLLLVMVIRRARIRAIKPKMKPKGTMVH